MLKFFLLSCYFFTVSLFAATPIESTISTLINVNNPAKVDLLKQLVDIPSGTTNPDGVKKVGDIIANKLKTMHFQTRFVSEPVNMHRAPTLIAEHPGTGKRILLIAHLDTVFAKDSRFNHYETGKVSAKGPGVNDDKGGIVVLLSALNALQETHVLQNASITVVLTGDEEDSGKPTSISRKPLIDLAKKADVALDFEPAVSLDTATVARRGISDWTIEASGNEGHSASIFQKEVGNGAIFELAHILETMRNQLIHIKDVTFNPGIMMGGTQLSYSQATSNGSIYGKQNVIAKIALVRGDIRYLTDAEKLRFKNELAAIVKTPLQGTRATLSFQDGIPAMPLKEANIKLLNQYSLISEEMGDGKVVAFDPNKKGAADISYVSNIVPANLSGLGPVGTYGHSNNESISLKTIPIQAKRAAILIYRLISSHDVLL